MLANNPNVDPAAAALLSDPATLARLYEPENLQAMMQIQQGVATLQRNGLLYVLLL